MNRNPIVTATWSALFAGVLVPGLLGCDPIGEPPPSDSHQHGKSSSHAAHPADDSPSGQMHAVMMHPMDDFKLTGNVDQDFAALMIPHHQGAIDMAQIELDHGKNEELKKMARSIMDAQAKEIAILKQYAPAGSPSEAGNSDESSPSGQLLAVMMRPMDKFEPTGDVDRDFAALMIPHHQGAIDMAKIELEHGTIEELKQMARSIIESQTAEIETLRQYANSGE